MFAKKAPTAFTINARDAVPDPPGHEIPREMRPPPKVYSPYRDCNGHSPAAIQKMIEKKRAYEEECERIKTENEIAQFETKHSKEVDGDFVPHVPSLPIPPSIDYDVIRSFEPPSATRYFDIPSPNIHKKRPKTPKCLKPMHHGCPCCNPEGLESKKARTRPATRNGRPLSRVTDESPTPRKQNNLPMQMNQAYWNVLDEPSLPSRPANKYVEYPKMAQFTKLRTGPRPAGIPIMVNDLMTSRLRGQIKFEDEMLKKKDKELYQREKVLHERAATSRNTNRVFREKTHEIEQLSGQIDYVARTVRSRDAMRYQKPKDKQISADELEAMAELKRYDDKLYADYQAKKRPADEMERLLLQTGMKRLD